MSDVILRTSLADDFHIHLRDGDLMTTVVPHLHDAAIGRCYVMPNLIPPVSTIEAALSYRSRLLGAWQSKFPFCTNPDFRMLLFLDPSMPHDLFTQSKENDAHLIHGIKSYPKGVTTNSDNGVESYDPFYPIFREMERNGKSLHLHGEVPGVDPLRAEADFLVTFESLCRDFPQLKIVLEHVSTRKAVESVCRLGPNVAATVTPQHALYTSNDVFNEQYLNRFDRDAVIQSADIRNPFLFCKPCLKAEDDRLAIEDAIFSSDQGSKFFFGSDSAPHWDKGGKDNPCCPAAGCYSAPVASESFVGLALSHAEEHNLSRSSVLAKIDNFLTRNGAQFFQLPPAKEHWNARSSEGPVEVEYSIDTASNSPPVSESRDGLTIPVFANKHGFIVRKKVVVGS